MASKVEGVVRSVVVQHGVASKVEGALRIVLVQILRVQQSPLKLFGAGVPGFFPKTGSHGVVYTCWFSREPLQN